MGITESVSNNSDSEPWTVFGSSAGNEGLAFLFAGIRRPESLYWSVPLDDEELLGGVGAGGSDKRKNDDTFETLLLMQMGQAGTI